MIIKQEEESPIQNAFDKTHLEPAFRAIETMAGDRILDTDLLKEYCDTAVELLKQFTSAVEKIEKDELKKSNKSKVKEHLFGNDPYGD